MRNLNRGLLVHTVEVRHLHIILPNDVLGGAFEGTGVVFVGHAAAHFRVQTRSYPEGLSRPGPSIGGDIRLPLGVGVAVAMVSGAVLGIEEQVTTGQSVDDHIHSTGKSHQTTSDTEVGLAGRVASRSGHTTRCEGQGQNQVHQGVDNHVDDDTVQSTQTVLLATAEHGRLLHTTSEVEEHDRVENNGAKLGEEDPDIVAPEALIFVLWTQPALYY